MNNVESLAKASKELCLKEPFYGLLLMSLNKVWDPNFCVRGNATLGVMLRGINYELRINPSFWESLTPIQRLGVLKHELEHIGFFHLTDYGHFENKEVLNISMDIVVNQYIDRDWLPENGCFLDSFPHLNLEPRKGSRYYYEKLIEAKNNGDNAVKKLLAAMCSPDGKGGDGDPNDQQGNGIFELPDGTKIQLPDHDWDDIAEMDDATKKLIENQTKHIISQVADQVLKSRGTIPGEFAGIIERINNIEPPKFDWKGYIKRFAGKSTKTFTKKSKRKYNKRLPDNPGIKLRQQKHILFAIDTSGSVSNDELRECLGELYHLQKTGSEITIIQCDTTISDISKFDSRKDFEVHGRGGTEFQPVIDYYNERLHQYSCLMYFTDGEAPAPENARGNILWILSERSDMNKELPGEVIKLEL